MKVLKMTVPLIILTLMLTAFSQVKAAPTTDAEITAKSQAFIGDTQLSTADCPTENFINVQAHPANSGVSAPQLNVYCNDQNMVIESNGIPNFEFTQITPNSLQEQNFTWSIPLNPTPAAETSSIPLLGTVAVAVNGLPIYGPNESPQHNYGDPYLDQILDFCNGHTGPRGEYHFHARPDCLFTDAEGNTSLVLAYALDGYPILAPYICEDANCTSVKEVQSSWQRTTDVTNAWEAHQYVEGSGDLDECNGMYGPDGSYRYYATDTFPYFLGCYRGVANTGNDPGGPPNGNPGEAPNGAPDGNPDRPPQRGQGPGGFFGNFLSGLFGGQSDTGTEQAQPQFGSQEQTPQFGGQTFGFEQGQPQFGEQAQQSQFGQPQFGGPGQQQFGLSQGQVQRGRPNLEAAAQQLGIDVQDLRAALGAPPPDFAQAAQQLGISESALREALGPPPGIN